MVALCSLCSDIEKIQAGIGDKLALFLQYLTTFVTGFVIAYSINWKLALVLSIMLPLLTAMAFLIARVSLLPKHGSEPCGVGVSLVLHCGQSGHKNPLNRLIV